MRTTIGLGLIGRVYPAPFVTEDGRAVAWVEIGDRHEVGVYGAPDDLRELAAVACAAADQAEDMQRIAEQIASCSPAGAGRFSRHDELPAAPRGL
jgi:hypothetical protein